MNTMKTYNAFPTLKSHGAFSSSQNYQAHLGELEDNAIVAQNVADPCVYDILADDDGWRGGFG